MHNIDQKIEEIEKRLHMFEIRANERDVKHSKTELLLEPLLEVATIQPV